MKNCGIYGIKAGLVILLTLGLSSCATLSKEECLVGNWQAIGMADGAAGYGSERLSEHSKACAKAGVAPNVALWEAGRQQGLKQYCTSANAYELGKRGHRLNAVCPNEQVVKLSTVNADGRRYYALNKQLTEAKQDLKKYQDDYEKLKAGENLEFKTEKEARAYLVSLPNKTKQTQNTIKQLTQQLASIRNKYGY